MDGIIAFVTDGSLLNWITIALTVVGSFRVVTTMTPNTTDDAIVNGLLKFLNYGSLALGKNRVDPIEKTPTSNQGGFVKLNVLFLFSLIMIAMIFLSGCAGVSTVTGPQYLDMDSGKHRFDAKVVYENPGVFTPSTAAGVMMNCISPEPFVATDIETGIDDITYVDAENEELMALSRCKVAGKINHDTATPIASGFIAPVVNSMALAYGAHEIGKGIGKSGDTTTNTDNSSNTNGQLQGQQQGQRQRADAEAEIEDSGNSRNCQGKGNCR